MTEILLVDDEKAVRDGLRLALSSDSYEISECGDLEGAYQKIARDMPDLVLLDVHFRGQGTCISLLERLKREDIKVPIIILSGAASAKEAADAIRLGAYDFLEKPVGAERLRVSIHNALDAAKMRVKAAGLAERATRSDLVGKSSGLQQVKEWIQQFARRDVKVLITGETGTGKELVAEGVWRQSPRAARPFIVVNCAAIPETLMESELFGHRKGAFTGAMQNQVGKIELADGGTLFLDEVAELSPKAQSTLLRFLETGEVQVIGANRMKHCDVRLIAATSRDLTREIKAGRFREDLYFRLNVGRIEIPSLRERKEDIIPIFEHFVAALCAKYQEAARFLSADAQKVLLAYDWPGNVRELRNVAERALLLSEGEISGRLLKEILKGAAIDEPDSSLPSDLSAVVPLKEFRRQAETRYINHVLKLAGGSVTKASHVLEVDRSHLHQKMKDAD